jgi:type II secretion system protein N
MLILKKRVLWYILYGIVVTAAFLYLLFPADIVKNSLEAAADSQNISLQAASLRPSWPLGIILKNLSVSSADRKDVFFQGEILDLQVNILSLLQKNSSIGVSGKAYGGSFNGRIDFVSFSKVYPPVEAKLSFQNMDLGKYSLIRQEMGKTVAGKIKGSLFYNNTADASAKVNGGITLFLTKGSYQLAEPFLGLTRIEIDRCEIQAQLKNGVLKLEKMEIYGSLINCSLKGDIILADDLQNSQLNLTGMIEILGKNKMKTNVTVNGTLANPVSRYI